MDMDSVPPATTMEALPVRIVCAPRIMAFRPEAQTLFTVVATVDSGREAPSAHCLAGFWPRLGMLVGLGKAVDGEFGKKNQ